MTSSYDQVSGLWQIIHTRKSKTNCYFDHGDNLAVRGPYPSKLLFAFCKLHQLYDCCILDDYVYLTLTTQHYISRI